MSRAYHRYYIRSKCPPYHTISHCLIIVSSPRRPANNSPSHLTYFTNPRYHRSDIRGCGCRVGLLSAHTHTAIRRSHSIFVHVDEPSAYLQHLHCYRTEKQGCVFCVIKARMLKDSHCTIHFQVFIDSNQLVLCVNRLCIYHL